MNDTTTTLWQRLRAWELPERDWFNLIWFQLTWFICVIGRTPEIVIGLAMIALHLVLVGRPRHELRALAGIAVAGVAIDGVLTAVGIFDFNDALWLPPWLIILWLAFAATLSRCLRAFAARPWLAAVVGGFGVSFNYGIGERLGAVVFPQPLWITAAILILVWTCLFPVLFRLDNRLRS